MLSLINYDGSSQVPEFIWETIRKIRVNVFDFIAKEPNNNYVLTNALNDDENSYIVFDQIEQMALKRRSLFLPVMLEISIEEHLERLQNKERLLRYKSTDPAYAKSGPCSFKTSHQNLFRLDVSKLTAQAAAEIILNRVQSHK